MSSTSDRAEKIRAILGHPAWARMLELLRNHRDSGRSLPTAITLADPTDAERQRHAALLRLSVPSRARRLSYDLAALSAALARANAPSDWDEILALLFGPIPPDVAAIQRNEQLWREFWPAAASSLGASAFPAHAEWLEALRRDGVLRRLAVGDVTLARHLLENAASLLRKLPLAEEQPISQVAACRCGGSHELDPDRPLATLVLRNLAALRGTPLPSRAEDRRNLWEEFGVVCDELSAPVLALNLSLEGDAPLVALTQTATLAGEPLHLTTRLLWATPWAGLVFPPHVFVCENPTIVALAATHLGPRCRPLVCIDGEIKTAARLLLRALRTGGARLHYHGDFDWPGVGIAECIMRDFGAHPWRFDEAAYRAVADRSGRSLAGASIPTPWSPGLALAMAKKERAYDEEALADLLIPDLAQP